MHPSLPENFDFTDPTLYAERLPHEEWAELRRTEPIHWNPQERGVGGFDDEGYWVVTRHADVKEISRRTNAEFSASENTAVPRYADGTPREIVEMLRFLILNQDGPDHAMRRKIISRGFTPRVVVQMREGLAERAREIVQKAAAEGRGDFIIQVASELPLQAIAELIGVPQEDRHKIFEWSNLMTSYDDPDLSEAANTAAAELLGYSYVMAEDRAACPKDDLVTKLIEADLDGDKLTSEEFGWFVVLLAVAGNETTRNATARGMIAFLENPDQWELFKAERPATAYDEILRWASPITSFQRTATEDVTISGVEIKKGQRLALMYGSANFDEEVFEDPFRFDITRSPNPHLTFGGNGPHYCIGANLARLQIELIFNAVADHLPDITSLGDPQRVRSGWLNGVTSWPVAYTADSAARPTGAASGCPVMH